MIGYIWYDILDEKIKNKWNLLIQNYQSLGIVAKKIVDNKHSHKVEFSNGDIWRMVPASDDIKVHRCNISYIDIRISPEVISTIINHVTTRMPYHAFLEF